MHIQKAVVAILFSALLVFSQDYVNIQGKVTDTDTTNLAGAVLKLEKMGIVCTTGTDGNFTLTNSTGINAEDIKKHSNGISANIRNGVLFLDILKSGVVEVAAYTVQGREVLRVRQVLDRGRHSIKKPETGVGVYIYRIKLGGGEFVIKSPLLPGSVGSGLFIVQGKPSTVVASRLQPYERYGWDTVSVTKDGYLHYRRVITELDTSGMEIILIKYTGTVTDVDGNVYHTLRFGNQVWTVENFRATKYNDKTPITMDTIKNSWANATTEKFCYYNNNSNDSAQQKFGALYNWYAVNTGKLAPAGWHVPADTEWDTLQNYLIAHGYNYDGTITGNKIAKAMAAKVDWGCCNGTEAIGCNYFKENNNSGFSAIGAGCRTGDGSFSGFTTYGGWWSSTEADASGAWGGYLTYNYYGFLRGNYYRDYGLSIRLVKDKQGTSEISFHAPRM